MSHTLQHALTVRPAALAVIAFHGALVVGIVLNLQTIAGIAIDRVVEIVPVPPAEIDPRPQPHPRLAPTSFSTPVTDPDKPIIDVFQTPTDDSNTFARTNDDPATGSSEAPFVWVRPQVLAQTEIPYPTERGVKPEGTVRLRLRIGIDGRPLEVSIGASSGHPALDRAALNAVAHWRFKPRLLNGQPIESWAEMPIVFRLAN